jgi:tyrosyl-tRNA synthetase
VALRPAAREAQRALAWEVTSLVHSTDAAARVRDASLALFGRASLDDLDARTVGDAVAELPSAPVEPGATTVLDLLVSTGLVAGLGAARRTVAEGGAYLNNEKVTDAGRVVAAADLVAGRWALVRRGRRTLGVGDARRS